MFNLSSNRLTKSTIEEEEKKKKEGLFTKFHTVTINTKTITVYTSITKSINSLQPVIVTPAASLMK